MSDEEDGPEHPPLELDPPEGIAGAASATEILRAWVADGALQVTFEAHTFQHDVAEWGRLLSDIAHHVAHAVELDGQLPRAEALKRMGEAFDSNLKENQAALSGRIKGRTEH
ncbi:MAG: DUF5076 domain-containing protein [Hyphomicrobiaceae bacterium]|nr:DUF5076 domain-containing protein [Hyphomicrobiaceae bacterium]